MTAILAPEEWKGRTVYMLEVLMFIREQINSGNMPEIFIGFPAYIGYATIETLESYIDGYLFSLSCHRIHDAGYKEFLEWLRDVKKESPAEGGWVKKCLEE